MFGAAAGKLYISYFFEIILAQCSRGCLFLFWQLVVFKIGLVRMPFLECDTANLFQYGQIVTYSLDSQSFLNYNILLKFTYKQLIKLAKGKV